MRDLLEIAHALSIAGDDDVVYVILERRLPVPGTNNYKWVWKDEAVIALHKESSNETYGDNIRAYYFEPLASDWCKSSRDILSDYVPDAVLSLHSPLAAWLADDPEPYKTRLVLGSEYEANEIYKRHESWTGEK